MVLDLKKQPKKVIRVGSNDLLRSCVEAISIGVYFCTYVYTYIYMYIYMYIYIYTLCCTVLYCFVLYCIVLFVCDKMYVMSCNVM